jgi:hypothetical protein
MVERHREWIAGRLRIRPADGSEIWRRRREWFPNLDFCAAVEAQLENLPHIMLNPVIERLEALQRYSQSWESGPFEADQLGVKASLESQATLEQFGTLRSFVCPDGIARIFSWHIRLTPLEWRVHFLPLAAQQKLLVGYIGRHLRTARFR